MGQRAGTVGAMPEGIKTDGSHGRTTYSPQKLVNDLAVATLEGRGWG